MLQSVRVAKPNLTHLHTPLSPQMGCATLMKAQLIRRINGCTGALQALAVLLAAVGGTGVVVYDYHRALQFVGILGLLVTAIWRYNSFKVRLAPALQVICCSICPELWTTFQMAPLAPSLRAPVIRCCEVRSSRLEIRSGIHRLSGCKCLGANPQQAVK